MTAMISYIITEGRGKLYLEWVSSRGDPGWIIQRHVTQCRAMMHQLATRDNLKKGLVLL